MASSTIAQLLFLESQDAEKPIYFYINSPGGSVSDGLAIYDTMQFIRCPVHTVAMGMAASMGSLLLTAGEKGSRAALPNSRIMIHQPSGGVRGQASDISIVANEILHTRKRLNDLYAQHTGKPVDQIGMLQLRSRANANANALLELKMERDSYMSPEEAVRFGLIDKILSKREA